MKTFTFDEIKNLILINPNYKNDKECPEFKIPENYVITTVDDSDVIITSFYIDNDLDSGFIWMWAQGYQNESRGSVNGVKFKVFKAIDSI